MSKRGRGSGEIRRNSPAVQIGLGEPVDVGGGSRLHEIGAPTRQRRVVQKVGGHERFCKERVRGFRCRTDERLAIGVCNLELCPVGVGLCGANVRSQTGDETGNEVVEIGLGAEIVSDQLYADAAVAVGTQREGHRHLFGGGFRKRLVLAECGRERVCIRVRGEIDGEKDTCWGCLDCFVGPRCDDPEGRRGAFEGLCSRVQIRLSPPSKLYLPRIGQGSTSSMPSRSCRLRVRLLR